MRHSLYYEPLFEGIENVYWRSTLRVYTKQKTNYFLNFYCNSPPPSPTTNYLFEIVVLKMKCAPEQSRPSHYAFIS
jgi:hypothetical protein